MCAPLFIFQKIMYDREKLSQTINGIIINLFIVLIVQLTSDISHFQNKKAYEKEQEPRFFANCEYEALFPEIYPLYKILDITDYF